jgi:3-oxoacyl-[acyl-carrier protein] reductase
MLMEDKTAVVFGGSGAIGAAVGHALARHGAQVHLGARTPARLNKAVESIRAQGGRADSFQVDALDSDATQEHMARLAKRTDGIDIVVNATSFMHDQGKEICDLSLAEFLQGVTPFLTSQFNIAKAVAPHMGGERAGTIISVVAPAARMAAPGHLGHIVGCAGTEAFTKALASDLSQKNIRVLCLRSHAISDAAAAGSYTRELFAPKAQAMGLTVDDWLGGAAQGTMLKRLPALSQVAETIAFLASDHAGAMTATVVNMTAGLTTELSRVGPAMQPGNAFPLTVLWQRLDVDGLDACIVDQFDGGFRLSGTVVFLAHSDSAKLDYVVICDGNWLSTSAMVTGRIGGQVRSCEMVKTSGGRLACQRPRCCRATWSA